MAVHNFGFRGVLPGHAWTTVSAGQRIQDGPLSAWETVEEPGLSVDALFAQLGQGSEPGF